MQHETTGWSRGMMTVMAILVVLYGAAASALARQDKPARDPSLDCALRIRAFAIAAFGYANTHNGRLPPDLYTAISVLAESDGKVGVKEIGEYARTRVVSPAHVGLLKPPAEIDAPWVNEHSSYRYLGNADVAINDIPEWGGIVIAHLRLEQGHMTEVGPTNPEGQTFTLAFLDGHVETHPRADAERLIAKSIATFEALRTGADAPPDRQAVHNIAMILKAIHAYAKANDGKLPQDLGATLSFVPRDKKGTASAQQRGRIYLSPRAQKSGSVPDEPTPEWVNANTGYVYLGSPEMKLDDIPEAYALLLVHARWQDALVEVGIDGEKNERMPVGTAGGSAHLESKAYAQWIARESEKTFLSLRTGEGMPDWVHAMRDVRLISDAVRAYTKAHDGMLPPNLGEAMAFLPEHRPGMRGVDGTARIFLSPKAEATTPIPDAPTPAWIAENASYVYHAAPGTRLPEKIHANWLPLLHGRVEEAYRIMPAWNTEIVEIVPSSDAFGSCWPMQKQWLIEKLADPGTTPKGLGGKQ